MADITYQCHHCGSVHEVESIRQNLYLDQRSIASYEPVPGRSYGGIPLIRLGRRIAVALWPRSDPGRAGQFSARRF